MSSRTLTMIAMAMVPLFHTADGVTGISTFIGEGKCIDIIDNEFDSATLFSTNQTECESDCEQEDMCIGFQHNVGENICDLLFSNGTIPAGKYADTLSSNTEGVGEVFSSDGSTGTSCYKMTTTASPTALPTTLPTLAPSTSPTLSPWNQDIAFCGPLKVKDCRREDKCRWGGSAKRGKCYARLEPPTGSPTARPTQSPTDEKDWCGSFSKPRACNNKSKNICNWDETLNECISRRQCDCVTSMEYDPRGDFLTTICSRVGSRTFCNERTRGICSWVGDACVVSQMRV